MIRFILQRTLRGLISLFLFLTFLFFGTQLLIPGDFTTQFAMQLSRSEREAMQLQLGLDRPLLDRYWFWLRSVVSGEFGNSFYGYSVLENLKAVLPPTLLVFLVGTIIAFLFGQWLGRVTAWRGAGLFSGTTTFSAVALYTAFPPWLAFLMVYFFVRRLHIFRPILSPNPSQDLNPSIWAGIEVSPNTVINWILLSVVIVVLLLMLVSLALRRTRLRRVQAGVMLPVGVLGLVGSWFAFGFGMPALDMLYLAALPIFTFVLLSTGDTMLIMQSTMQGTLDDEYVRTARAKGLSEAAVRDRHAARNAIIPVFSRLVVSLPYLLTGIVIIERPLNWPGMGENLFQALYTQDMPVVMGSMVVIGVLAMVARLGLELFQVLIDPRVRDLVDPFDMLKREPAI